jgi:tetratricopeptide (TPR) repeat protein
MPVASHLKLAGFAVVLVGSAVFAFQIGKSAIVFVRGNAEPAPPARDAKPRPAAAPAVQKPAAKLPVASAPEEMTAEERRAKARAAAKAHWPKGTSTASLEEKPATKSQPTVEAAASPRPAPAAPTPAAVNKATSPVAAAGAAAMPQPARRTGRLGDIAGLAPAISALEAARSPLLADVLAAVDDIKSQPQSAGAWNALAGDLKRAGHAEPALAAAEQARRLAEAQSDRTEAGTAVGLIADIEHARGNTAEALEATLKAIEIDEQIGRIEHLVPRYVRLAEKAIAERDAVKGEALLTRALEWAWQTNRGAEALQLLPRIGDLARRRRDFDTASRMYQDALALSHRMGQAEVMADQYANLGRTLAEKGERGEADTYWRSARDQYERLGLTQKAADAAAAIRQSAGMPVPPRQPAAPAVLSPRPAEKKASAPRGTGS